MDVTGSQMGLLEIVTPTEIGKKQKLVGTNYKLTNRPTTFNKYKNKSHMNRGNGNINADLMFQNVPPFDLNKVSSTAGDTQPSL